MVRNTGATRKSRRLSRISSGMGTLSLAFLLFGNAFKGWPLVAWLPVDPAIVGAVGTLVYMLRHTASNLRLPRATMLMIVLYILALPCIGWTQWNPYAQNKAIRLFTVTLLATIAPPFIIREREDLRVLWNSIACMGFVLAVSALIGYIGSTEALSRVTAHGMNPIWFARLMGMAALWPIANYTFGRGRLLLIPVISFPCLVALIGSGSKGPLMAFVLAFAIMARLSVRNDARQLLLISFVIALGAIAIVLGLKMAPEIAKSRILEIVELNMRRTDVARSQAWAICLDLIPKNPLGIGLGGFSRYGDLLWPHNLILETFLEIGWLGGIYLVIMLLFAFRGSYRLSRTGLPELVVIVAYIYYELLNALVSGDLTSAKVLLALVSVALSLRVKSLEQIGFNDQEILAILLGNHDSSIDRVTQVSHGCR